MLPNVARPRPQSIMPTHTWPEGTGEGDGAPSHQRRHTLHVIDNLH